MRKKELVDQLAEALLEAQEHLDYCGYGDNWERSCAMDAGLPEKIRLALKRYKEEAK